MADKSKDYNVKKVSDDSAAKKPEEPSEGSGIKLLRAVANGVVLLLVLAVVILAAYQDGTGFDFLRRWFAYGTAEQADSYAYDAAVNNRFALLGDGMAVLSGTELRILAGDGTTVLSKPLNMRSPALTAGGDMAVAYDVGGTELWLVNAAGEELLHLQQPADLPLIAASVNQAGYLAVTAEKNGCKGCVSVYDPHQTLVFAFNSVERFVTDARVAEDGRTLTAVTLGQEAGSFVSRMVIYDLTKTEPQAGWSVTDGVVLALEELGGRMAAVCDTALVYGDAQGEIYGTYDYGGAYLRDWAVGENYTVLRLNRYYAGSIGRVVTVDMDGKERAAMDVNEEIIAVSAAGHYIAVLYAGRVVIYTPDLVEYARMEGAERAKDVLVCEDGSALVLESEHGTRFLP
ncbi:MAG: hypothetical protein E7445_05925 [Ruminococcaceae bacterium]|nr:hypothetical protein [Oscillospiraceae bacterium]